MFEKYVGVGIEGFFPVVEVAVEGNCRFTHRCISSLYSTLDA